MRKKDYIYIEHCRQCPFDYRNAESHRCRISELFWGVYIGGCPDIVCRCSWIAEIDTVQTTRQETMERNPAWYFEVTDADYDI